MLHFVVESTRADTSCLQRNISVFPAQAPCTFQVMLCDCCIERESNPMFGMLLICLCFSASLLRCPQSLPSSWLNRIWLLLWPPFMLFLLSLPFLPHPNPPFLLPSLRVPDPLSFHRQQLLGFCLWWCAYKQEVAMPSQACSLLWSALFSRSSQKLVPSVDCKYFEANFLSLHQFSFLFSQLLSQTT